VTIAASSLLPAAQATAGAQQYPKGALYVVATPIGNLADLSLRAIHVLSLVDRVACEDTRHSGALLHQLGVHKPLMPLHEHNEQSAAERICGFLGAQERVAYVSDAGTPAVSDPGAGLVAAVRAAGYRVIPIPGSSSAVAALSVAGDTVGRGFRFVGFLPSKGAERKLALQKCLSAQETQVVFEAPHRMATLAAELAQSAEQSAAADRWVTVCRELTKQFESVATMRAGELGAWLSSDSMRCRGEFVLVLHGLAEPQGASVLPEAAVHTLRVLLRELPLKQAVGLAADISGMPRNALYEAALALREEDRPA
jgi:16S rRNA (cytidine1402-2'-O)-methyltransferase